MVIFWVIVFMTSAIDQILKNIVRIYVPPGHSLDTFLPFLKITNIQNMGAAFGTMEGMRIYLIVSSLLVMTLVVYYILRKNIRNLLFLTFVAFVLGGGISNLYDRIAYGYVTDYLKLSFFPPVCNFADYCICFGAVAILVLVIKGVRISK